MKFRGGGRGGCGFMGGMLGWGCWFGCWVLGDVCWIVCLGICEMGSFRAGFYSDWWIDGNRALLGRLDSV